MSFDYASFRAEFIKKRYDTSYNREHSSYVASNHAADQHKAQAWKNYTPLKPAQLMDDFTSQEVTLVQTKRSPTTDRRSTVSGIAFAQITLLRITEMKAILHAMGIAVLDSDIEVIRQDPERKVWNCVKCRHKKGVENFAKDKRFPAGLAFYCKPCREDKVRRVWRTAIAA